MSTEGPGPEGTSGGSWTEPPGGFIPFDQAIERLMSALARNPELARRLDAAMADEAGRER